MHNYQKEFFLQIPPKNHSKKEKTNSTFHLSNDMKKKTFDEKVRERIAEAQSWEKRGMI